jgi:hypothetical protein
MVNRDRDHVADNLELLDFAEYISFLSQPSSCSKQLRTAASTLLDTLAELALRFNISNNAK